MVFWLGAIAISSLVLVATFKLYLKYISGWCYTYTCLVGKTAVITGANTGIGYYTALDLAKRGCTVFLACRNKEKAEAAKENIIKETGNKNIFIKLIDMESLESVRKFAKDFNDSNNRLDILVNNAGAFGLGDRFTKDNLQVTMQVNHFSNVLLTELLLNKLKQSAPSRIVNTSSGAAKFSKMTIEDLNKFPSQRLPENAIYCHSKLCNILFNLELSKRLKGTGVTANVLHPGAVRTEFGRNVNPIIRKLIQPLAYMFFKSSEEGAQTTIYLCTSREEEGVTGELFEDCKQVPLYKTARNPTLAKEVWEKSRELVGLK